MLEHVNLDVPSLEHATHFLQSAFPDFQVRGTGIDPVFGRWLHIGTDNQYVAFQEAADQASTRVGHVMRHLGWVVEDIETLMARLNEAGFAETMDSAALNAHPYRRRVYYTDRNGTEHEFVQYLSELPAERNDYAL